MLKIENCRVITDGRITDGLTVCVKDGKIAAVTGDSAIQADETIDGRGLYLAPGFIDVHSHGGGGADFLDNTVDAFLTAAKLHISHGTTTMLPTAAASSIEETYDLIETYKAALKTEYAPYFGGLHLEGPYFAPSQCGAQDTSHLRTPKPEEYLGVLDAGAGFIKRWSVAPELDGALELGRELTRRGIIAAIAHSDATYEEVLEAMKCGYTHITHLYSATSTVTRRLGYRFAGIVEAAWLEDDLTVEIIADGHHLPASLLRLIYKLKGPDKTALITDSIRGAGMPEGESILGSLKNGRPCIIEGGVARLPDRSAFAGSVATADRLVRTMITLANVPLPIAVKMATQTPAETHRLTGKGAIREGYDADLVLFDDDIKIDRTIIGGKTFWKA